MGISVFEAIRNSIESISAWANTKFATNEALEDGLQSVSSAQSNWDQNDETASDYIRNRTHYTEVVGGETVIHVLDEKYIPDSIARKNDITGGGGSGGSSAPADWSVNDPNTPGYVQNRTHWMDDPVEVTVLSEQTAVITEEMMAFFFPETGMEIGADYTMTIDGTAFSCTAYEMEGMACIGNGALIGFGNDTGEPFFAGYSAEESALVLVLPAPGEHTVSLSGVFTQYHPLDSKFLPPTVGTFGEGNGAEVFNTVMNIAAGSYSHAEGRQTAAYGDGSHAEGSSTVAQNDCAHAEGYSTLAFGLYSHAEGKETVSNAFGSHSEGIGTKAMCDAQHVEGKWNQVDTQNKYAHILGGGQAEGLRADLHTIDWGGNAWFAGNLHPLGGLILSSPNTTRYRVMVSDTGELYTEKITG